MTSRIRLATNHIAGEYKLPMFTATKNKGYEQDPNHGFLFPVKFIEEKYGESSRVPKDTSDSESSSDSSDDESSGCRGKPQATDESESAEEVRAERIKKDLDEHEGTDDYWVVNDDRVVRIRVTPRYHLFDPEQCPPPIPLDYLGVLRFTDTNVKGQSQLVDCWVTDPRADQVKGPWIGKTSFNVRMPAPKGAGPYRMEGPLKLKTRSQA